MKKLLLTTALSLTATAMFTGSASAQATTPATAVTEDLRPSGAQAFTPENAILNTAVLFAVGAREAQQSLRNAFGWPTFQEGLVKGVYFRFDPDGYARFSPSPRLDADVFEVICRPRTYTCMARKGPLQLTVSSDGRIQMQIDQVQATDTFALNDGFSELPIPPRLNGVLDPQMEALLSGGGSLVVRRNGEILEDISLQGFSAVHAYLLWVAARQDYSILPRDWPVPNGLDPAPLQTSQATAWPNQTLRSAPVLQQNAAQELDQAAQTPVDTPEMAALRSEVALLRDLLLAQTGGNAAPANPAVYAAPAAGDTGTPMPASAPGHGDTITSDLNSLRMDIGMGAAPMETGAAQMAKTHSNAGMAVSIGGHSDMTAPTDATWGGSQPDLSNASAEIRHLHYLTSEMGFDAQTALLILQIGHESEPATQTALERVQSLRPSATEQILDQLRAAAPEQEEIPLSGRANTDDDYALLTRYFQSVIAE